MMRRRLVMIAIALWAGLLAGARPVNAEDICADLNGAELYECLSDSSDGRQQRAGEPSLFHPFADPEVLEAAGATTDGTWVAPVSGVSLRWSAPWQAFNAYSLPEREGIVLFDGASLLAVSVLTGPADAEACVEQGIVETLMASGIGTPVAVGTPVSATPVAGSDAPEWMAGKGIAAEQMLVDADGTVALLAVGCLPGAEGAFVQVVHLGEEADVIASRPAAMAVIETIAVMSVVVRLE